MLGLNKLKHARVSDESLSIGATMKAFASHYTALAYWREHFPLDSDLGRPARISKVEEYAYRKEDVLACIPETYFVEGRPLDVLVFDPEMRRQSKQIACRAWSVDIPPRAFYRVGDMNVSSPEFVFLQMAQELPLAQLIALGCELCGTYVLLPKSAAHPESLDESPQRNSSLTSVDRLLKFVEHAKGAHGRTKALRALKYVIDGSRSPMETVVYMLLCLPPKLGGYGLRKPVLNADIPLDDEARAIAGRISCYGDLCWIEEKLDIEYHGVVHVGASHMKSDVGRELGIEHMGWRVITITSPQVFDEEQFEIVAKEAAAHLKKRLYPYVLGATVARGSLRYDLHTWMFAD